MKEVISIIRRHKVPETKRALTDAGFPAVTIQSVEGRGMQRGIGGWVCEIDPALNQFAEEECYKDAGMKFIPKRMLTVVVDDNDVHRVVAAIMNTNRTGHIGDGKIFICPLTDVYRVRTGSKGLNTLRIDEVDNFIASLKE